MPDIELVVKIPEESYKFAKECKSKGSSKHSWNLSHDNIVLMIANGTQLPKGHGKLFDENEIKKEAIRCEWSRQVYEMLDHAFSYMKPIIEADKEQE